MARRIKSRKRKHLGNRSWGAGNIKNRRGKGNKGGKGRAGFHKHKWFQTIKRGEIHGEKGFCNPMRKKTGEITLAEIAKKIARGEHSPDAASGAYAVNLEGFKVLSQGAVEKKLAVRASGFSAKAKQKIEAAGGTATTV